MRLRLRWLLRLRRHNAMTWADIITSALRMIGQLGPGQAASTTEEDLALVILNRMLNAWSAERLNIYTVARTFYTLAAGEIDFLLGDVSARPVKILNASLTSDGGESETELTLLTEQRYMRGENGLYFDAAY